MRCHVSLLLVSIFIVSLLQAQNYDVGNIAVVHGGANIAGGLIGVQEQVAGTEFYKTHADIYDFMVVFTTFTPSMNMQQGLPIQYTVKGINREGAFTGYGPASKWGSAGRLIGGTRMCHIDQYPDNPDQAISNNPISPFAGMSTVELLAHEFSHYWLMAMDFKKEGMSENHTGLRGWEDGANQHWNSYAGSGPSAMYGSHVVDNGDGSFTQVFSLPRKYGHLDQYVMGLRAPEEVDPTLFICSSSDIEQCREGSPAIPAPKTSPDKTYTSGEMYLHSVTIDDVIRAMGPRIPAAADAPKHWNVAFVIINLPGQDPFPNQLERLDTLRIRFQEWFEWATDGRATICTELDGDCSNTEPTDDDVVPDESVTDDVAVDTELPDDTIPDDQPTDNGEQPDTAVTDNGETPDTAVTDNGGVTDDVMVEESNACGCTLVF
ncbi:MAG TPA: hypothetical protein PLV42_06520 [bacterium]|nr:hypothetical protein [bacterium]